MPQKTLVFQVTDIMCMLPTVFPLWIASILTVRAVIQKFQLHLAVIMMHSMAEFTPIQSRLIMPMLQLVLFTVLKKQRLQTVR